MLDEQTLTQLKSLRLDGMVAALADHATNSAAAELRFEERLALLVQREIDWRDDKRLTRLLKAARLKVSAACIEGINWRASRGLDRSSKARGRAISIAAGQLSQLTARASALPNPSVNLTRYGAQRKPGPRPLRHHRVPGLRCAPTRAGYLER